MSSKYPIQNGDDQGIIDAINYLLSGPSGLGQYFNGFSAYTPAWLTGNYRVPFTQTTLANMYVAPILCSSAVQLNDRTFQYNFASTQPAPPFNNGNNIAGSGWANDFYNGGQGVIGVVTCTVDYVVFRTAGAYPGIGDDFAGGYVYWDAIVDSDGNPISISTDCNARVIVTGATDRVFISGQLEDKITYSSSTGGTIDYRVQINRYIGQLNSDPTNPDYFFLLETPPVAQKTYPTLSVTGSGTLPIIDTIFSTIIDQPVAGYYWYILEIEFIVTGDIIIESAEFGLRSLSAQVVKQ